MFGTNLINAVCEGANANGIEPAALLALVEVETSGDVFEQDGRTPRLLYERHVAWRQAAKVSARLQAAFAAVGLAIPKWSRATQYKDQGTSAKRLALIGRARGVDEEIANQSASWGVGQTMGFLYPDLGFPNACAMVDHMTGSLAGQIDLMIREIKNKKLIPEINAHRWPVVARRYNGPGYAQNRYDVRMADAYKRWVRKLAAGPEAMVLAPAGMSVSDIRALQSKLRSLGYSAVGNPDGGWGVKTIGALNQFQAHEGLPQTGKYDEATREAMQTAEPIEQPRERANATADDLAAAGSKTIKVAKSGGLIAWGKGIIGSIFVGGGAAEKVGLLEHAQEGLDKASQVKGTWDSFVDLAQPIFAGPTPIIAGVVLIAAGVAIYFVVKTIISHRVADHNSGVHAGTGD